MSGTKVFLDTNLLIYLYSKDELKKQSVAHETLNNHYCVISTQVLNEASNVWFKKYGWTGATVKQHVDNIETVCDEIAIVQKHTIDKALALKDIHGYSYYDCLILASALESGCEMLFSEDMTSNQVIEGRLRIVNPF